LRDWAARKKRVYKGSRAADDAGMKHGNELLAKIADCFDVVPGDVVIQSVTANGREIEEAFRKNEREPRVILKCRLQSWAIERGLDIEFAGSNGRAYKFSKRPEAIT
jgi:hypothetical protein